MNWLKENNGSFMLDVLCSVCVEGRATADPHYERNVEERSEGNPQICEDYCEIGEDDSDNTDKQICLVARDK